MGVTYKTPPLIEVAMSIQFDTEKLLGPHHIGAFWTRFYAECTDCRVAQPISPIPSGLAPLNPNLIKFSISNVPSYRLQILSPDDTWMIQLQQDRLVLNWRKQSEEYPRYSTTRARLKNEWAAFREFCRQMEVGEPVPQAWELTYVNSVSPTESWRSIKDLSLVFPTLISQYPASHDLDAFNSSWSIPGPTKNTSLAIDLKATAIGNVHDQLRLCLLSLVARGSVTGDATSPTVVPVDVFDGIDIGHEMIVQMFDSVTSDQARDEWCRIVQD